MTRTKRSTKYAGYFRRPKTHNQRKGLIKAQEEIMEELGPNYLGGNFAQIRRIPTVYDDLPVRGAWEDVAFSSKMETLYEEQICSLYGVQFDTHKNVFRIYKRRHNLNNNLVDYVPFCVTILKQNYPVRIKREWWDV